MEEDMQAFMIALRLRFSRNPLRFYMRLSLAMPALRTRLRWMLAVCRAPPE